MKLRGWRKPALLGALAAILGIAACTLNPQPLPPAAAESGGFEDGGVRTTPVDAGTATSNPETPGPLSDDAGPLDGGDAGNATTPAVPDGGDAGDAGEDADAGHS